MATINTIKSNIVTVLFSSVGTCVAIVGALFTVDARYAHASDVEKDKVQIQNLIQYTSQTLRRQMLEDKLFELDMKKAQAKTRSENLPPVDSALRDRYQRQLMDLSASQSRARSLNPSLPKD